MRLKTKEFYKVLAERYNISEKEVKLIDEVQFRLLYNVIRVKTDKRNGIFPVYRIPCFGIFYIPYSVRKNVVNKFGKDESTENK